MYQWGWCSGSVAMRGYLRWKSSMNCWSARLAKQRWKVVKQRSNGGEKVVKQE